MIPHASKFVGGYHSFLSFFLGLLLRTCISALEAFIYFVSIAMYEWERDLASKKQKTGNLRSKSSSSSNATAIGAVSGSRVPGWVIPSVAFLC